MPTVKHIFKAISGIRQAFCLFSKRFISRSQLGQLVRFQILGWGRVCVCMCVCVCGGGGGMLKSDWGYGRIF